MRILSRALSLGALLLAAPLAAPAEAAPPQPYHLADGFGHGGLQPVDWSGRHNGRDDDDDDWDGDDHDWDDDRRRGHWRHGNSWKPGHWDSWPGWNGVPRFVSQPLPVWVIEHRLRRQHIHPIGRITFSRGIYLVPVLDPHGRRIVLAVDPMSAVILGRARHW